MKWIDVNKELPSNKNGFVDESVLVCVKYKNKKNGIYLQDISSFDGKYWSVRVITWEIILYWRPLPKTPKIRLNKKTIYL